MPYASAAVEANEESIRRKRSLRSASKIKEEKDLREGKKGKALNSLAREVIVKLLLLQSPVLSLPSVAFRNDKRRTAERNCNVQYAFASSPLTPNHMFRLGVSRSLNKQENHRDSCFAFESFLID